MPTARERGAGTDGTPGSKLADFSLHKPKADGVVADTQFQRGACLTIDGKLKHELQGAAIDPGDRLIRRDAGGQ